MTPPSVPNDVLHDIHGPLFLADGVWWMILAFLVLTSIALLFFMKKYKQAAKTLAEVVVVMLPWDKALEELSLLKKGVWGSQEEIMEFYVRLSSTVRQYIEARFNIRAVEMTTEEFMIEAQRSSALTQEQHQFLEEFLLGSDHVKFAAFTASPDEMKQTLEAAKAFVLKTIPIGSSDKGVDDNL